MIRERINIEDYLRVQKKRKSKLILKGKYSPQKLIGQKIELKANNSTVPVYRNVECLEYINISKYCAMTDQKVTKGVYTTATNKVNLKMLIKNYNIDNIVTIAHLN